MYNESKEWEDPTRRRFRQEQTMIYQEIFLKQVFPQLSAVSGEPVLRAYLPDNLWEMERQEQKRPCLLICPGGAYAFVSQREGEPVALQFLTEGWNVFVLQYSVAPFHFPAQLCEVAAALELLYQQAEAWHCDTRRVAILGFSAGGHLAAHYSNAYAWPEVRALFPESRPVQGTLLCYPVISAQPGLAHLGSFRNLLGKDELNAEDVRRFSCQNLVSPQTPPAFLWHTAADGSVPVGNSLLYAQALAEKNIPFALHIYPAGGHGLATVDGQTNDTLPPAVRHAHNWLEDAKAWLRITFPDPEQE